MNRTFNILLLVGCAASIVAAFVISVKPAGTTATPISQSDTDLSPSLPPLNTNISAQPASDGIARDQNAAAHWRLRVFAGGSGALGKPASAST